jgi:HPt (histidine-containing phosphotransfer) domain-containing protein
MPAVLDLDEAMAHVPGGRKGVAELAQLMLAECPKWVEVIRKGIEEGDARQVQIGAHTLKGSASILAARRVEQSAGRLENLGREGQLADAREVFEDMLTHVQSLTVVLSDLTLPEDAGV